MVKSTLLVAVIAVVVIVGIGMLVMNQKDSSPANIPTGVTAEDMHASVIATGVADMAGVQFDVTYNPAVVRFDETEEGTFLDSGEADAAMLLDTATDETGAVKNIILLRVRQPGVDGTGALATLHFTRIGPGAANIALANVLVSDGKGKPIASELVSVLTE